MSGQILIVVAVCTLHVNVKKCKCDLFTHETLRSSEDLV